MLQPLRKNFVPEQDVFQLIVAKPSISAHVVEAASKTELVEKDNSHISIIVTENSRRVVSALKNDDEHVWQDVASLAESFDWATPSFPSTTGRNAIMRPRTNILLTPDEALFKRLTFLLSVLFTPHSMSFSV